MHKGRELLLQNILIEKSRVLAALLFGFLLSMTGILLPLFLGKFYQLGLHTNSSRGRMFENIGIKNIDGHFFLIAFLIFIILRFLISLIYTRISKTTASLIVDRLSGMLFEAQINSSWETFSKKPYGNYLLRYSGDLNSIKQLIENGIIRFISDILFLVSCVFIFFILDTSLAFTTLIVISLFAVPIYFIQKNQRGLTKNIKKNKSLSLAFVQKAFSSFYSDWVFNKNPLKVNRFEKIRSNQLILIKKKLAVTSIVESLSKIFPWTILSALMFNIMYLNNSLEEDKATNVLVFFLLIVNMSYVLRRTIKVGDCWSSGNLSMEKLANWISVESLQIKDEPKLNGKQAKELEIIGWSIGNTLINQKFEIPKNYELIFQSSHDIEIFYEKIASVALINEELLLLDGQSIKMKSAYHFRRSIVFVSKLFEPQGKNLLTAIAYSKNNDTTSLIASFYSKIGLPVPSLDKKADVNHWKEEDHVAFQFCRAWLTNKPFIFVDISLKNTCEPNVFSKALKQFDGRSIISLRN